MTDDQRDEATKAIMLNSAQTVDLLVEIRDTLVAQERLLKDMVDHLECLTDKGGRERLRQALYGTR